MRIISGDEMTSAELRWLADYKDCDKYPKLTSNELQNMDDEVFALQLTDNFFNYSTMKILSCVLYRMFEAVKRGSGREVEDYYKLLGVSRLASGYQIITAYKKKMADKRSNPEKLQKAFDIFTNFVKKQEYDNELYMSNSQNPYRLKNDITRFLTGLRLIGTQGVGGTALLGKFRMNLELIVAKFSYDSSTLHEYFMGLACLNKLRKYTPGFAYVLGGFQCAPLQLYNAKGVMNTFCQSAYDNVNYVIYEKIDGSSLEDYIATSNTVEIQNVRKSKFLVYFIQILFTLQIAQERNRFVHNDLHQQNIILRKLRTFMWVKYTINKKDYYVVTDRIPTIIDYGRSAFDLNRATRYAGLDDPGINVYAKFSSGTDMRKLLFFCLRTMSERRATIMYDYVSAIASFFEGSAIDIVTSNDEFNVRYALPEYHRDNDKTPKQFYNHILKVYPDLKGWVRSEVPKGERVLDCYGYCLRDSEKSFEILFTPIEDKRMNKKKLNTLLTVDIDTSVDTIYSTPITLYLEWKKEIVKLIDLVGVMPKQFGKKDLELYRKVYFDNEKVRLRNENIQLFNNVDGSRVRIPEIPKIDETKEHTYSLEDALRKIEEFSNIEQELSVLQRTKNHILNYESDMTKIKTLLERKDAFLSAEHDGPVADKIKFQKNALQEIFNKYEVHNEDIYKNNQRIDANIKRLDVWYRFLHGLMEYIHQKDLTQDEAKTSIAILVAIQGLTDKGLRINNVNKLLEEVYKELKEKMVVDEPKSPMQKPMFEEEIEVFENGDPMLIDED